MRYEEIERAEPAAVVGVVTALSGFLALLAADFSTLHSAGLALGMSGSQVLFTRPSVFSEKTIDALKSEKDPTAMIPEVLRTGGGYPHPNEPTLTVGLITLLGGFLVQLFGGVDFTAALASAAGIAGVQTAATRSRVFSPATARQEAARRLVEVLPPSSSSPLRAAR